MVAVVSGIILCCSFKVGYGGEPQQTFTFNGFAFWLYERDANPEFKIGHAWLIFGKKFGGSKEFTVIVSPYGPPKLLHNLHLTWEKPFPGVRSLRVGRFGPELGWQLWTYRIDQTPTIFYSTPIDANHQVARDSGLQLKGNVKSFNWTVSVFIGDRTGGNIPASEAGRLDYYTGVKYSFPFGWVGTSHRFGPLDAQGYSVGFRGLRKSELTFESLESIGSAEWYLLCVFPVERRTRFVYSFEHLHTDTRNVVGIAVKPDENYEIKLNFIGSRHLANRFVGQLVIRW